MTRALSVEPITLPVFISVIDVTGKSFGRRRGIPRCNPGVNVAGWWLRGSSEIRADDRFLARPIFERLVPGERDQRGGHNNLYDEAHVRGMKCGVT